jgi:hypothetical protein
MLFESLVTNVIYYGAAFILYATNVWIPTLTGIALLFGVGNAFDSIVSLAAYLYMLKKRSAFFALKPISKLNRYKQRIVDYLSSSQSMALITWMPS